MGKAIQVSEGAIREALIKAEDDLLAKTGHRFFFRLDRTDEAGLELSVARDDGAEAEFEVPYPRLKRGDVWQARPWLRGEMDKIVERLALGLDEDEPPPPEQRFAVAIVFGGRPDVVLTPERGVPADEAVRVYSAFLAGAAAIGGRPALLPLGA
ncbi:hypothetical protein [Methylobacterium indicum]|nr:hypothetical protein [Methylobacterium indicum]